MNRAAAALMCTLLSLSACGERENGVKPQPSASAAAVSASDEAPRSTEQNTSIGALASDVSDNLISETSDAPPPSDDNG